MKLKYLICGVALSGLMLASCDDQMNYHEYKINDKEFIESTFGNVGNFMTHIYRDLDYDLGQMYGGASLCSATDEAVYSHQGNPIESFYNGSWSSVNYNSSLWNTCLDGIA
ncbi:MAG: RagB/SusD family nutrient uptake outer membrane protein, partial [Muribaculaceae bacterium]|nr:RagB/SusD family nutrient uptake outer membrane protein [Muribaculaceae bacterium]